MDKTWQNHIQALNETLRKTTTSVGNVVVSSIAQKLLLSWGWNNKEPVFPF